jgi:hypothetical protein
MQTEEIRTIARRLRRVLALTEETPMHMYFWDDLNTLLNILRAEAGISIEIKTIAERLKRKSGIGEQALLRGVFWDDLDTLLNLILEVDSE